MPLERESHSVDDCGSNARSGERMWELKCTHFAVSEVEGSHHRFRKVYGKRPTEFSSERAIEKSRIVISWGKRG